MKYNYIVNNNTNTIEDFLKYYSLGKTKYKLIKSIYVNNVKSNLKTKINNNDNITIDFEEQIDFIPQDHKLNILYEDDYLLLVDKDVNLLVHPDSKDKLDTLVNYVASYYKSKNEFRQVHYLHRIDTDTSGIVMFAKDFLTTSKMAKLIESHEVARTYLTLVEGIVKKDGTINEPIGEDRHHNQRRRVSKTGKDAITDYKVIKQYNNYTLLEVKLRTGRTHQIRVHMSYIKHPLLGDELYFGNKKLIKRQALHSHSVEFIHPITNKNIIVKSELKSDMKKLVK
ncbi:MAG: RluA family pseudouridine synthase [bacterium]